MKKTILLLAMLAAAVLILGGCFRKHIESTPAARQPARVESNEAQSGVIEETHVVGEDQPADEPLAEPIEEVYEVGGAKDAGSDAPKVAETDLAEEPLPDPDQLRREAEAAATENEKLGTTAPAAEEEPMGVTQPAAEPEEQPMTAQPEETMQAEEPVQAVTDPEAEVVGVDAVAPAAPAVAAGGEYFVQVGAFSELENANRVLGRLLREGYKDSVLIKTDTGMYRVQAGSFPDEAAAGEALEQLRADFPEGFVLKKP